MDISDISTSQPFLIIGNEIFKSKYEKEIENSSLAKFLTPELLKEIADSSVLNVVTYFEVDSSPNILSNILRILKPEGKLIVVNASNTNSVEFKLKTNGFVNVTVQDNKIRAYKPKYAIGSSAKLNLKKPAVWKLDYDGDDDLIDPDDLLDEDDLAKPDPSTLRVCGTTGQRKACKDCSCGLAEELASEVKDRKTIDTKDAPKSSCGNCYLGDAFRCASCPYLGMPAFKPGEKIQLTSTQLKSDV